MKFQLVLVVAIVIGNYSMGQKIASHGATDTLLFNEFYDMPGNPTVLSYNYTNGNGYFFGTNFIDVDQVSTTPYEPGAQAFAQGFKLDTNESYHILDILVRVGVKVKSSVTGTPLILSVHYLDDSSNYTVNTATGSIEYTIGSPGTSLGSASIAWDNILTGANQYSVAHFNNPIYVEKNFTVVVDLIDFYLNGDKIGLWTSSSGGGSAIYGNEFTLWLYPNPLLWLQVNHIYSSVNRAIAIFPVVDDGTFSIDDENFYRGMKLGQSYPNPTTDFATIEYQLEKQAPISLEICDATGKVVHNENLGDMPAGLHSIKIDAKELAPGIFYYTLFSGNEHITKKMLVK